MNDKGPFSIESVRSTVQRVGFLRVAWWFVAINIPITVVLPLVISIGKDQPGPLELALRGGLMFLLFGAGAALFLWLIARASRES